MAETSEISKMAVKLAHELFNVFGWKLAGPENSDWDCATKSHEVPTHPSDVVFYYDNPYSAERVYVTTDMKSFGKGTIRTDKLAPALTSMARSVDCAHVSETFQRLYIDTDLNWRVDGLLFVYNHDLEYKGDFWARVDDASENLHHMRSENRFVVCGPDEVNYLATVRNDIQLLRGDGVLPRADEGEFTYYYPDLVNARQLYTEKMAATLEMLTGPWIIIRHDGLNGKPGGFIIWHRGTGASPDEFTYLFDFIFRYQLLQVHPKGEVLVLLPAAAGDARAQFEKAKSRYADRFSREPIFKQEYEKRLGRILYRSSSNTVRKFSEIEIGMEARR